MTQASLRDFMSRVVPWPAAGSAGVVNIHSQMRLSQSGEMIWSGRPTRSVDEFVSKVSWALQRSIRFKDIFFCLSLQGRVGRSKNGKPKAVRSQADALALRSIWLDIDVKAAPKGYSTLSEALKAFDVFIKAYNLPFPTALVGSGGGLHVYWISDTHLSPDEWRPYAEGLRAAAVQHGFRCDGGVTVDSARILRVPGTFNSKIAGQPRPVQLLHLEPTDINFAQALGHLAIMATTAPAVVTGTVTPIDMSAFIGKKPAPAFASLDPSESLAAGIDYSHQPINPAPILAEGGCQYFREALRTGGKEAGQGLWMLTVLASTFWQNGDAFAHELSNGHPGYKVEETDAMIERKIRERAQRGLGWPSCMSFEREGCTQCKGCPHRGQIRSPLNLATQRAATRQSQKDASVGQNPVHELGTLHAQALPLQELLREFNKRFAVVRQGQDVLVAMIKTDEVQTFTVLDFHRMMANLRVGSPSGRGTVEVSQQWFSWRERRQYLGRGCVFEPGGPLDVANDCINLWRGFAIKPAAGEWRRLREHIFQVICSGNRVHFDYLLRWLAYSVQNLQKPVGVAVALRGDQGAGKGILARTFGSLFGKHFAHVTNGEHLTGRFNAGIGKSLFVFLDEAIWAADKRGDGVLKALITEPVLQVEAKYRDPISVENRLRIMVASNSEWLAPVGVGDRRWFVLDVANTYAGPGHASYWKPLHDEIDAGAAGAMFHDLLQMDLAGFDIRAVPITAAKVEQQTRGLKGTTAWLYSVLQDGKIGFEIWGEAGLRVSTDMAYENYCSFSKQLREHHPHGKSQWSKDLRKLLGECLTARKAPVGPDRIPHFIFSPLPDCRRAFAARAGLPGLEWEEFEDPAAATAIAPEATLQERALDPSAKADGTAGEDDATPGLLSRLPTTGSSTHETDLFTRALAQAEADMNLVLKTA